MSKGLHVKNRAPAQIQITAEQLLREANDHGIESVAKAPKQFIADQEELALYQQSKRKDFEDQIRRNRHHIGIWCKYALWEASQKEFDRSRSVFERALDVEYKNQTLWMKYTDMEMQHKFVNHARNLWDRAVTLLPRVDNFWYKYSYMEEMVGAIDNARDVFERWMKWEPDDMGWAAFIKFEMRQGEVERARQLYERYTALLPTCRAYLKYAAWEEKNRERGRARGVFERSLEELHPTERSEKLLINFARFEERCKEIDRARVIYQYALSQVAKEEDLTELKKEFLAFEKRHGNKVGIEDAILTNRRETYEAAVEKEKYDYDAWFDYIHLEEAEIDNLDRTRAVYSRAVQMMPPIAEKRHWKRYIYLWINYALFEELVARDISRARAVYRGCIDVIPHKAFTFGKIWLLAAQLEVRQKDLPAARKLLGVAIGLCGKPNIFRGYIELEQQLGEVDRCRTIYTKYIQYMPHNCDAWQAFAQLEASVGETVRARAIYELAVTQIGLDMPEIIWKSYIDFELSENELQNVRNLYERLLERSEHVKVFIAYGRFEAEQEGTEVQPPSGSSGAAAMPYGIAAARAVFKRGYETLKLQGLKEERLLLLEAWREAEDDILRSSAEGQKDSSFLSAVEAMFPRKVKAVRSVGADGSEVALGDEYYYDYIFPDDEKKAVGMKILERAMMWKTAAAAAAASSSSSSSPTIAAATTAPTEEHEDL